MTMHLTTTSWSFPDSAIGKKYILARTSNGYELVPDGSKVPGIPVSAVVAPNSKPQVSCTFQTLVHELKQRFCQHERHPKIGRTNFGGILHHGARARKQKTLKILCFVVCVEDYHKLTQTQFLIQSPPLDNLTSMLTKTSLGRLANIFGHL
jgi:hypothetical protein